jgi:NADPH:quinone reductase
MFGDSNPAIEARHESRSDQPLGGPEVLELIEAPTPTPGPRDILVCVRSIGVNFAETLMRQNRYAVTPSLPAVLGAEVAGTVESLGPNVHGFAVGQRVAAPLFAMGALFGGCAEFVVVDAGLAALLPDAISCEQPTAVMIQGLTALYLTRQAPPKGETVLVNAAAGGVGTILV